MKKEIIVKIFHINTTIYYTQCTIMTIFNIYMTIY